MNASGFCGFHASLGAFSNEVSFKFCNGRKHVELEF